MKTFSSSTKEFWKVVAVFHQFGTSFVCPLSSPVPDKDNFRFAVVPNGLSRKMKKKSVMPGRPECSTVSNNKTHFIFKNYVGYIWKTLFVISFLFISIFEMNFRNLFIFVFFSVVFSVTRNLSSYFVRWEKLSRNRRGWWQNGVGKKHTHIVWEQIFIWKMLLNLHYLIACGLVLGLFIRFLESSLIDLSKVNLSRAGTRNKIGS